MAYRKQSKSRRSRRASKKTYRSNKRKTFRKSRHIGGTITRILNTLKPQYGVVLSHLRTNAVPSAVAYYSLAIKGNSIFNIDAAQGGTTDVKGIDALEALFDGYTVFSSSIKVTVLRNGINQNFEFYLIPYRSVIDPASYGTVTVANMQRARHRYVQVANTATTSAKIMNRCMTSDIYGVTKRAVSDDTEQYGTVAGASTLAVDPGTVWYWNLLFYPSDGQAFAAGDTFDILIDMVYKCRFQTKTILDETL